jgi:hypothetical protein
MGFLAGLLFFASVSQVQAGELFNQQIFCMQQTPTTEHGFIIEQATVTSEDGKPYRILVTALGSGLVTSEGDGTIQDVLYEGADPLYVRKDLAARSKKWRDAIPFQVPLAPKDGKVVLYIQPKGFLAPQSNQDYFEARLKITKRGKEKNYTLLCNAL